MNTEANDLRESLATAYDLIHKLTDEINGLVLRQTAILAALAETLPNFAPAFDRIHTDALSEQEKRDSEVLQTACKAFRNGKKTQR